jgi:hypothetical protein
MEQPVTPATILGLEHLPPFQKNAAGQATAIASYLEALTRSRLDRNTHYLELPSVNRLSGFFGCSFLGVYDAFRALREKGFDYQFSSVDGAMLVWRQNVNQ